MFFQEPIGRAEAEQFFSALSSYALIEKGREIAKV
jgi:hypothetical protein